MKRLTAFILCAIMCLSLCACDSGKEGSPATDSDLTWEEIVAEAERQLAEEEKNAQ